MEFKAAKNADNELLSQLSEEALCQIKERQYFTELAEREISEIQLYGIAFSGKKAIVKNEIIMV